MTDHLAVIIPADPAAPITFSRIPGTLAAAQSVVGGDIEGVRAPDGVSAFCNADGKLTRLAPNTRATLYLAMAGGHNIDDVIVGDVLIIGDGVDGETVDVPESVVEGIKYLL